MDAVIAYVNNTDPVWIELLKQAGYDDVNNCRFRDYGLLKYLIRGIEKFMPYVENIFIIVSSQSQIPEWANDKLKFILHKDFIPKRFLPTFNSCTIECFLPLIKDLGEEFVYFNDDMYLIDDVPYEDAFQDGLPVVRTHCLAFNAVSDMYILQTKNSQAMAFNCKVEDVFDYYGMYHRFTPLLKSVCLECYKIHKKEIFKSCSQFREFKNVNLYLYPFYHVFINKAIHLYGAGACFYSSIVDLTRVAAYFNDRRYNNITLNDYEERALTKELLLYIVMLFDNLLPDKSSYEN